jgi:hypothetical protein
MSTSVLFFHVIYNIWDAHSSEGSYCGLLSYGMVLLVTRPAKGLFVMLSSFSSGAVTLFRAYCPHCFTWAPSYFTFYMFMTLMEQIYPPWHIFLFPPSSVQPATFPTYLILTLKMVAVCPSETLVFTYRLHKVIMKMVTTLVSLFSFPIVRMCIQFLNKV